MNLFSKTREDWEHKRENRNPISSLYLALALALAIFLLSCSPQPKVLAYKSYKGSLRRRMRDGGCLFVLRIWHHLVVDAQTWSISSVLCKTAGCPIFYLSAPWVSIFSTGLYERYYQTGLWEFSMCGTGISNWEMPFWPCKCYWS